MNKMLNLATGAAAAVGMTLHAETSIRIENGTEKPVTPEVLGVNQLAYGRDSYGFLLPGKKTVQPEMAQILKEIGVRSMRYPGGCGGTHMYDWKKSAGMKGGYQGLGLLQFLKVCEETGAEPMLGISAFRGTPEEAAEFVEFLNAPDDGKSKWAAARAKLGHPEPYNIHYIEYGNETYHGNHYVKPQQRVLPEEYARNYLAFRKAMKAVDPKIQLGLVLGGKYWDTPIFRIVGNEFDFVIHHFYHGVQPFAETEYIENFSGAERFRKEVDTIRRNIPRPDLKIAITEFNSTRTRHHTLTAALFNASLLQAYLETPGIFAAHYWQFCNEGFGMVRGRKPGEIVKRPNALMYELFSANLLDRLVPIQIEGRMTPVRTVQHKLTEAEKTVNLFQNSKWYWSNKTENAKMQILPGNVLKVEFLNDYPMNFFHIGIRGKAPKGDSCAYRLTAEIRTEGMETTSGAQLQFGDGRGWDRTQSITNTTPVLSNSWTPVTAYYKNPLSDIKTLEIKVRRITGGGKGAIYIRNLKVTQEPRASDSDKVVAGMLTASKDGKTLALLLTNRSFSPETVTFDPATGTAFRNAAVSEVSAQALTGPDAYADNETKPDNVAIVPVKTTHSGSKIRLRLPPHSLTGVRISLK